MRIKIVQKCLELLFPSRCAVCDSVVGGKRDICPECKNKLVFLSENVCMKCGKEISEYEAYCYDCKRKNHFFDKNVAVFSYPFIRKSLYRFKYAGRAEYAKFYAKAAVWRHLDEIKEWNARAIIPVPLHKKRLQKRGYNQAKELAKELGKILQIPVLDNLVARQKHTLPMKHLQASKRQNNLKKAFLIMENDVKLNTIILVDDIYTTGATLDELSKELKRAGVKKIYSITVAIGNSL